MAVLNNGTPSILALPPPVHYCGHGLLHFSPSTLRSTILSGNTKMFIKSSHFRIRTYQHNGAESSDATKSEVILEDQNSVSGTAVESIDNKNAGGRRSFLSILGILLGIAAVITLVLVGTKLQSLGTSTGIQLLQDGGASALVLSNGAFSFRAFGYTVVLPEYAPGWIYFWQLVAAGCGLFISD